MRNMNIAKILFDFGMTCILVRLYNSHVFAISFHEIAGLTLAGLFVVHCLFNRKWIAAVSGRLFDQTLPPRIRVGYIVDVLLFITFAVLIISGIRTSQVLFPQLAAPKGTPWRVVHHFTGALSIVLVGIHVGLHWSFVSGISAKGLRLPKKLVRPIVIVLLALLLGFGVYSLVTSSFVPWLIELFTISTHDDQPQSNEAARQPKDGKSKGQNHSLRESKTTNGNGITVPHTMLTFLSMINIFAAATRFADKHSFLRRVAVIHQE